MKMPTSTSRISDDQHQRYYRLRSRRLSTAVFVMTCMLSCYSLLSSGKLTRHLAIPPSTTEPHIVKVLRQQHGIVGCHSADCVREWLALTKMELDDTRLVSHCNQRHNDSNAECRRQILKDKKDLMDETRENMGCAGNETIAECSERVMNILVQQDDKKSLKLNSTSHKKSKGNHTAGKLKFILHVGPCKMAATAIQDAMTEDIEIFKEDGYCLFPEAKQRAIGLMLSKRTRESQQEKMLPEWKEFLDFLDDCYENKMNVLFSSKYLGHIGKETWKDVMKPAFSRWHTQVLVGYRRYYSWVRSVYSQIFRLQALQNTWPDGGKGTIPGFLDWVFHSKKSIHLFSEYYIENWKKHVHDVVVYNMHERDNIAQTFYCGLEPLPRKACKKRTGASNETKANAGYSLEYDRLVVEAHDRGLIPSNWERTEAAARARMRHEQHLGLSVYDWPLKCMNDKQATRLLNMSLAFEKKLVPDFFSSEKGEPALREEFANYSTWKLCDVDIAKVLEDEKDNKLKLW